MTNFSEETLKDKTNAELCEILTGLGGTAPKSGKFRTKAEGVAKILALAESFEADEARIDERLAEELPAPETPAQRLKRILANATDEQLRRKLRKNLRRIGAREAKRRRIEALEAKRRENGVKARRAAAKVA